MTNSPTETPDLDQVFHALADPSRRKILGLLREAGELRVSDLAQAFAMSLNGVSKHLKVLERAQLVLRRIDGREHWIRVNWPALEPAHGWLDFHHQFWSGRLDALADYVEQGGDEEGAARRPDSPAPEPNPPEKEPPA